MKEKLKGTIYLLLATVIWGGAFTAQTVGMDHVGPFTFQALRCALASIFLFPLRRFTDGKTDFWKKWSDSGLWKTGFLTGLALFFAAGLQQVGLQYTTAGKAGFLTAMYIVLVPSLGLFYGSGPGRNAWIGVATAVVGLYLLSGSRIDRITAGDGMLIGCAFFFAVQIRLIDRFGLGYDGVRLNCVQSLFCALFSGLVVLLTEEVQLDSVLQCWLPLSYAGILSMGVAYSLQIFGQQLLEPTQASILMSLESVFALIFGWLLLKERLSPVELAGCAAMFGAVILSPIPKKSTG